MYVLDVSCCLLPVWPIVSHLYLASVNPIYIIGVNLYCFGVALAPPPNAEFGPAIVLSAPAIIEGYQSMKWSGLIRWINNPVQSLELIDFAGFVT